MHLDRRRPLPARGRAKHAPSTTVPASAALLLVDVVNPFDFEGSDRLLSNALPIARNIGALKRRARRARLPIVYVNDNFGEWRRGLTELVARCTRPDAPGRAFVEQLLPRPDDYYVLKPRHSGFHSTSLEALLDRLGVRWVVLAGIATHICVQFTAIDAYMLGLGVIVPSDCVAAEEPRQTANALEHMAGVLKAAVAPSRSLRFTTRRRAASPPLDGPIRP